MLDKLLISTLITKTENILTKQKTGNITVN